MIDERFKLPLMDFVERAGEIPHLVAVILFGSVVKGEVSKKSDIDLMLLFDTDHDPELGEEAKIARRIASEISMKHDLKHPFSFIYFNRRNMEEIGTDFLWNVIKEGVLIWGRVEDELVGEPPQSLEPMVLIQYTTKELEEKNKRKLLRKLYSSKEKLMDKDKERLGRGVILTRAEKFDALKDLLDSLKVSYSVKKIWSQKMSPQ
jgi:predicted nucleotidyltransferase